MKIARHFLINISVNARVVCIDVTAIGNWHLAPVYLVPHRP
jgi:hypothetical protein